MTLRLAKANDTTFGTQRPLGTADRTQLAALRAGLFRAEPFALLNRCRLQCPFGQATRRRAGDLLHLREVYVEPRSLFPEGMLDDNFPPLFGEALHRLELFRRQLPCCHGLTILEVTTTERSEFPEHILLFSLCSAKGVLHS